MSMMLPGKAREGRMGQMCVQRLSIIFGGSGGGCGRKRYRSSRTKCFSHGLWTATSIYPGDIIKKFRSLDLTCSPMGQNPHLTNCLYISCVNLCLISLAFDIVKQSQH